MNQAPGLTHRASRFGLVHGQAKCWSCKTSTPVAAILLDAFTTRWGPEDEWEEGDAPALLSYISYLSPEALAVYQSQAPWVQLMASKTAAETYWGNACIQCGALQGDWHLHEPDAPFFPTDPSQEASLSLTWHDEKLEAVASDGQASWMDRLVERQ